VRGAEAVAWIEDRTAGAQALVFRNCHLKQVRAPACGDFGSFGVFRSLCFVGKYGREVRSQDLLKLLQYEATHVWPSVVLIRFKRVIGSSEIEHSCVRESVESS
jgi:hypothetical protein